VVVQHVYKKITKVTKNCKKRKQVY